MSGGLINPRFLDEKRLTLGDQVDALVLHIGDLFMDTDKKEMYIDEDDLVIIEVDGWQTVSWQQSYLDILESGGVFLYMFRLDENGQLLFEIEFQSEDLQDSASCGAKDLTYVRSMIKVFKRGIREKLNARQ